MQNFCLDFRFQSPCDRSGFDKEQRKGNTKRPPGVPMTDLRFDPDISCIPRLTITRCQSVKFGLTLAYEAP